MAIKTNVQFLGVIQDTDWPHFAWSIVINGERFDYKTGLGHRTDYFKGPNSRMAKKPTGKNVIPNGDIKAWIHVPEIDEVLNCLFRDAESADQSFDEFCNNLGYSTDSIRAFNTYRACAEARAKLRKALGKEYQAERERIQALEL